MTIKNTVFGRHYAHDFVTHTHMTCNNGVDFEISAPKNGFIIAGTVRPFYDSLMYACVQQLNNCDACIVTTSCVHTHGHFNSTMRLVSYDTVVCEVSFLYENISDSSKPYMRVTIGEHWNYSRTTVQHVYKFLRMFGITNLSVSQLAKYDKKHNDNQYSYTTYQRRNNVDKLYEVCFTDDTITDFRLNNACRVIDRMYR